MLYWLLNHFAPLLEQLELHSSGDSRVFLTARTALASVTSFLMAMLLGPPAIRWLKRRFRERIDSASERLNELHANKGETPTMGGLFVVGAIVIAALLWGDLTSRYTQLALLVAVGFAALGAVDDWIKLSTKRNGLTIRQKLAVQIGLALAAIAMAVSALVLLAKTVQFCGGKCSLVDLGLAVLDVIPFGKFGKMADAVNALGDATKFAKFSAAYKAAGGVGDAVKLKAFPDIMTSLHAGLDVGDFTRISEYGKIWGAAGDIQGALAKQANSFYSTVNTIQGLPDSAVDIFA
jgi:hypothetical protein